MDISVLKNERGFLSLLELSQPRAMALALGLDEQVESNRTLMAEVMNDLLVSGGQEVSGLVLEPEWGLPAYSDWLKTSKQPNPPVLALRLDSPPSVQEAQATSLIPTISPDWGVEQVANNYALAFLELPYNPAEPEALAKKQLVAELFDFCQNQKTQLILKLVMTDEAGGAEVQLTSIQELRASAHLLALEVPNDPLAAATLTAELDIPWIATPGPAQSFPQFNASLSQALENGAQGFLIGQPAWGDISQLKRPDHGADIQQIKTFINTTFRERLQSLNQVLAEAGKA